VTAGFVLIAGFVALLAVGMPIAFALGTTAIAGFVQLGGLDSLIQVPIIAYQMLDSPAFLALPLFIVMGTVLLHGRIGGDFFELARAFVGHRRAGLAIATIVACAIFSAISASSLATAATIGALSVPSMLKQGYPPRLVYGPVAAGGTLGILIPPSGVMILYGAMTNVSVGDLFIAGIFPGILLTAMLCGIAIFLARGRNVTPTPRASWPERAAALRTSFWGLMLPVFVLGGLYAGFFTPNEAGAIGVVLSLFVTVVVKRTLPVRDLPKVFIDGTRTAGFLFGVIIAAGLFNHLMTELQFIQKFTALVTGSGASKLGVLLMISGLIFVMGMFFEVAALVLIMVPVLFPVVTAMGIDPVWFGIFFVVNVEFAYLTPPVGMNLFIIQEVGRRYRPTTFQEVVASAGPYLLAHAAMLAVLLAFPAVATGLLGK
jgi:C4-dicarboxylate transporter DctM subunit